MSSVKPDSAKRDRWDARYAAQELVWSAGPNALLARELIGLSPGTALDAGCGEGRNGLWLAEQGWQVTAVDFSAVGTNKGRQIADRRGLTLNWLVADVARDPLPDVCYDLVVVLYLHTDPEERALWLPRLIKAVAPGGTFFYLGHDPSNITHGTGGPQNPDLLPSVEELSGYLVGFEILTQAIQQRPVTSDPGHSPTTDSAATVSAATATVALDTYVRALRTLKL